ncbi:MAG: ribonuclease HII [Anaerolineae bacterium]
MCAKERLTPGDKSLPTVDVEAEFWQQGIDVVAGLDEAGRGPWAGPVYAAAVVLPQDPEQLVHLGEVRDSKLLSHRQRERLLEEIRAIARVLGVGFASSQEIDTMGIVPATCLAMRRALDALAMPPQALIIDALTLPHLHLPQKAFPRADASSLSVAAASIVAKVSRDHWMIETAATRFPGYGFDQHKGYGTKQHQEALDRLGVCPLHRRSFRPVAKRLNRPPDPEPLPGF